jgi:uncharacterized damage-inducible protein DinB
MTLPADYFPTLARYNGWANERLYTACSKLGDAEYYAPRVSFFGSIHATLNHILVADRIWLGRLCDKPCAIPTLDTMLYEDRRELASARAREDARILAMAERWTDSAVGGTLTYKAMDGGEFTMPLRLVLGHLFNHQTHHRGQVHGLLSQTEVPPPPLDLGYFIREAK